MTAPADDGPDYAAMVRRWLEQEAYLRASLKADGIHVGWGNPPTVCLVCQEVWPCKAGAPTRKPRRGKVRR